MKQKNMVLMAVAVGCGLIAAFLTANLRGGPSNPEMVEVIVAKKEIKIGTVLEEKDLNDLLTKAPFMRATLPPDVINNVDDLKNRRLSRTLRAGNYFAPSDINVNEGIPLPAGTRMYSVSIVAQRASAGFIMPGDRVEVLALQRHPTNSNLVRSRLVLADMLALAVDHNGSRPEGGAQANPTINSVSLAVTPEQAKLLHNCESCGGEIRMLRGGPNSGAGNVAVKVDDWYDLTDLYNEKSVKTPETVKGPETVQVAFAKQDIDVNTRITGENLGDYFELRSFLAPAPGKAIKNLSDLSGKFVRVPLSADTPVMANALSDSELAPAAPIVIEKPVIEYRDREKLVPVPVKPTPVGASHELIIQNGRNTERHKYEGKNESELKIRNGNDPEPTQPTKPAPDATLPPPVEDKPSKPAKDEKRQEGQQVTMAR